MNDKSPSKIYHLFINFIIGGLSNALSTTLAAPFQRAKLFLKLQDVAGTSQYKNIFEVFTKVYKDQGLLSFWKGNLKNIRLIKTQALNFAFKDLYQQIFRISNHKDYVWSFLLKNVAIGGIAGVTSFIITYPYDLAKSRLSANNWYVPQDQQFKGFRDYTIKIYRTEGLKGLYQGAGVSLYSIFIYRGIYFGCYDTAKGTLLSDDSNIFIKFIVAQSITVISGITSYPFDTIRRSMMMRPDLYKNTLDCMMKIAKTGGKEVFFRGAFASSGNVIGGMMLVIYDELQKYNNILGKNSNN